MKYDVTAPIRLYNGDNLQELVVDEETGEKTKIEISLGKFLTLVCIQAQAKDVDAKYKIYKLLGRIDAAEKASAPLELEAKDIELLKKLAGEGAYSVVAVGAVCELLEQKE